MQQGAGRGMSGMPPGRAYETGPLPDSQTEDVLPYADASEHLRDELQRVWMRVEYQIRLRWELGVLPSAVGDAGSRVFYPEHIANLFRNAAGLGPGDGQKKESGAQVVLEQFIRHSAQIEMRVQRSLSRGIRLPLAELAQRFGLTRYQHASLLFSLMPEVDPDLLTAYRYLSHETHGRGLDGKLLALLVYDTPELRPFLARDLSLSSPLLRYRLLELEDVQSQRESLFLQRVRVAARLVQMLTHVGPELDPQLQDFAELHSEPLADAPVLSPALLARTLEALCSRQPLILLLQGQRGIGKRTLLRAAAARLGKPLLFIHSRRIAALPGEAAASLVRGLLRELVLLQAIPVAVELDDALSAQTDRDELPEFLLSLSTGHRGATVVTLGSERMPRVHHLPLIHVPLTLPDLEQREQIWRQHVSSLLPADARLLATRFAAPAGIIASAARAVLGTQPAGWPTPGVQALDQAVRHQLHNSLLRLGHRLDTPYEMEDLIVDDDVWDALCEVVACMRSRRLVREQWKLRGAQGVTVLFSGDPGVGKTMSATVLARTLGLEIYEIDLSQIVSKWIGETEKNLSEVFDAAEPGHAVLLFNEADALFNRRTAEVHSANDRFANMETNYLLQRLERFGGLAILTSNLTHNIDPAFRRRFAYDIQFSFPTPDLRVELWRRAIPRAALSKRLDISEIAMRYELSGGFIKLAVERAAVVAAGLNEPLTAELLTSTIERMYRERGKLTTVGRLD